MAHIDIQHVCDSENPITNECVIRWAETTLKTAQKDAELTIRFVEPEEMIQLNHRYRQQQKVTNVLAFPAQLPDAIALEYSFLGDVVICPSVLETESVAAQKPLEAHWAHIVIHGILHLLGYDHINPEDALIMEAFEIKLLKDFGYDNPYSEDDQIE